MIADASDFEPGRCLEADLCIVGGGAAGIALALQFEHRAKTVLLLEAGGPRPSEAAQANLDGSVADVRAHPPLKTFRRRVFGGATAIWGGRCVPFDPMDFAARPWMQAPSWPIGYADILAYYEQASLLCEAGDFAYTAGGAFPLGMRPVLAGFHGAHFTDASIERFSCPTRFAARYGRRLRRAANIQVILHACVIEIRTAPGGASVAGLRISGTDGRMLHARAKNYVLAAGGLEVPRLLLASRDHHPNGLGNAHDQVGRCYMTHLAGTIGQVFPGADREKPFHGYEISDDGIYCRRRFAVREAAQRSLGTGNFVARLHHPAPGDPAHRTGALSAVFLARPFIGYEYAKNLRAAGGTRPVEWFSHARNVALDPASVAALFRQWLVRRALAPRKYPSLVVHPRAGPYSLDFHAEQAPNPESRVILRHDHDALGLQKLHVAWRASNVDRHTLRASFAALATDFAESACATLRYDPAELASVGAYGGHHIGTARMSLSPRQGVVNGDGRAHDISNLFIAGSAVFPTSSQANPTLTVVALAVRLGVFLRQQESVLF